MTIDVPEQAIGGCLALGELEESLAEDLRDFDLALPRTSSCPW
jgi:hypothetical protein